MGLRKLLALIGVSTLLGGCTLARAAYVATHSPTELPQPDVKVPIYAEAGAEPMARLLAAALPHARARIESTHGAALDHLPPIVVCATDDCYRRYAAGQGSSAETLRNWRISINGALIQKYNKDPVMILTHELSHYFWYERGIGFQPRWFEEGLGVWVSGGGGAETISVDAAERAIVAGVQLRPTLDTGLWSYLRGGHGPEMDGTMYYRQSGMFIQYLHDTDPRAFQQLLAALRRDGDLGQAWGEVYRHGVDASWNSYVASVRARLQTKPVS